MHVDKKDGAEILVCTVGKTIIHHDIRCLDDLHQMFEKYGDWMELASRDEKVATKEGTVEHWGHLPENLLGSRYGPKKNFRGRFGMYIPPLM